MQLLEFQQCYILEQLSALTFIPSDIVCNKTLNFNDMKGTAASTLKTPTWLLLVF